MKNNPPHQKLFETLQNVADFTALQTDMQEIIIAVKADEESLHKTNPGEIIKRIIGLPFFLSLNLIGFVLTMFSISFFWLKYGGEASYYNQTMNRKGLNDLYFQLKNAPKLKYPKNAVLQINSYAPEKYGWYETSDGQLLWDKDMGWRKGEQYERVLPPRFWYKKIE